MSATTADAVAAPPEKLAYVVGFDPTAASLHLGHLMQVPSQDSNFISAAKRAKTT